MYCGVIEGIAGLSVTLTRIAGGKSMVDGSLTVMANLNLFESIRKTSNTCGTVLFYSYLKSD